MKVSSHKSLEPSTNKDFKQGVHGLGGLDVFDISAFMRNPIYVLHL